MSECGTIKTYFMHPLTNSGGNTPGAIKDNLVSLDCIVRLAWQRCPQIKPIVPQAHWACLIGLMSWDEAMRWCRDELLSCSLAYWPQIREGPRAGENARKNWGYSKTLS